jgi:hypothetical protein
MAPMTTKDDSDLAALGATWMVKAAAIVHAVSGLFTVLGVVQLAGLVFFGEYEPLNAAKWGLAALGALAIVLATRLVKMRMRWTIAATLLALVLAPLATAWLVLCVSVGAYSLMQSAAAGASWLAVVLLPLAIPDTRRASSARTRLAASGLDIGL